MENVQFGAPASGYDRFMGRYASSLAPAFVDAAGVRSGGRACDVGCGPGALTAELVARLGAPNVAAIDPAPQFVAACRDRNPGADVREGVAEQLPWDGDSFDATLSSLVIGFMRDADHGVAEMARVTRPGGTVAACMWDIATGGMTMLTVFWNAVRVVDPDAVGESAMVGTADGDIAERLRGAGLVDVTSGDLTAHVGYRDFDDFWEPFTFAVGPAGTHLQSLAADQRAAIRDACRAELPDGPFTLAARAWYARGTVPS
ncbi:class I SAM-dependent methyltransferase [Rhodococcus triatomae]|nr:type 11 methyltransferase [Rhodococcus triatomae BKS 15-14]